MINMKKPNIMTMLLMAFAALFLMGAMSQAAAVDYWLDVQAFDKLMPDGVTTIRMWGYASCTNGTFGTCAAPTVPGPVLTAVEGDELNITVRNSLPAAVPGSVYSEPTSLIINGQPGTIAPVTFLDPQGRTRVRSFAAEAAAAGGTQTYTFDPVRAGTYLYQSGTHPSVQIQMGLYGTLKVSSPVLTEAYPGAAFTFDKELVLLFSEVAPDVHAAIADGTYGTAGGITSTIDYKPRYFLINGEPFTSPYSYLFAGLPDDRILLRFLNAGLESHVPTIMEPYLNVIAEDGNPYSFSKQNVSMLLPAGKTMDAIITPTKVSTIVLFDRRLRLTNDLVSPGGMMVNIYIGDLTQPVLTSPTGTINTKTPTYVWSEVPGATSYQVYVKTTAGVPEVDEIFSSTVCNAGICSAVSAVLLSEGPHLWTVRGVNAAGDGPWGVALSFIVDTIPPTPGVLGPSGVVTEKKPVFSWNSVTGAVSYRLYITNAAGQVVWDTWYTAVEAGCSLGGVCSVTPTVKLKKKKAYSWQVMAQNAAGVNGLFSAPTVFAIGKAGTGFAILIAPTGTITIATPTYQWTGPAGGTSYQLIVNRVVAGQLQKVIKATYTAAAAGCAAGGTCSVTPATALTNADYQWTIQATNAAGKGPVSMPMSFTKQ